MHLPLVHVPIYQEFYILLNTASHFFINKAINSLKGRVGAAGSKKLSFSFANRDGEEYNRAYKLFDYDGDGDISAEEIMHILNSVGELPGHLSLMFSGRSENHDTDYKPVIQWLTFLIKHS